MIDTKQGIDKQKIKSETSESSTGWQISFHFYRHLFQIVEAYFCTFFEQDNQLNAKALG